MNLIIIEINAHESGHYTQEINQFCKHIISLFNSVTILTPFGFKDIWDKIENCKVEELCKINSVEIYSPLNSFIKLYEFQWDFYKKAFNYVNRYRYNENIIHIWDIKSIFPIWFFFKNVRNIKVVNLKAVQREQLPVLGVKRIGIIQGWMAKKFLIKIGDKYIVHTKEIFNEAFEIGIKNDKIYEIGIGIDNLKINITKADSRIKLKLYQHSFIILFFGVIREEKGIYELFDHIKDISENFVLYIVGENRLNQSIEDIINELGIKIKVVIESRYIPESELEEYFRACDSVIICHRKEFKGESGVLLKALQYQIPIIANSGSNSAEIVEKEGIGTIFDISKPGTLSNAVSFIRQNKKLIDSNLILAQQKHSWKKIIPSFKSIYFSNPL